MHDFIKQNPLSESQLRAYGNLPDVDFTEQPKWQAEMAASVYTSDERFNLEQERIFRAVPVPIAVSASLPNKNSYLVNNDFGLPILLTRASDGEVRAFLNVCQHRGALLCDNSEAKSGSRL